MGPMRRGPTIYACSRKNTRPRARAVNEMHPLEM